MARPARAVNMPALLDDVGVRAWLARIADDCARDARQIVPVRTGRLRDSITSGVDRDARGIYGWFGSDVEYAGFVEYGTRHVAPQPYIRPALYGGRF